MKAAEIIEKYEVPKEFHEAVFEAYAEGSKRGYIAAASASVNAQYHDQLTDLLATPPTIDTLGPSNAPIMPSKETT